MAVVIRSPCSLPASLVLLVPAPLPVLISLVSFKLHFPRADITGVVYSCTLSVLASLVSFILAPCQC